MFRNFKNRPFTEVSALNQMLGSLNNYMPPPQMLRMKRTKLLKQSSKEIPNISRPQIKTSRKQQKIKRICTNITANREQQATKNQMTPTRSYRKRKINLRIYHASETNFNMLWIS